MLFSNQSRMKNTNMAGAIRLSNFGGGHQAMSQQLPEQTHLWKCSFFGAERFHVTFCFGYISVLDDFDEPLVSRQERGIVLRQLCNIETRQQTPPRATAIFGLEPDAIIGVCSLT